MPTESGAPETMRISQQEALLLWCVLTDLYATDYQRLGEIDGVESARVTDRMVSLTERMRYAAGV